MGGLLHSQQIQTLPVKVDPARVENVVLLLDEQTSETFGPQHEVTIVLRSSLGG